MELPFTIVFEPPSRTELRDALRMRGTRVAAVCLVLAIGIFLVATGVMGVGRVDAVASAPPVALDVTSRPSGAALWIDGRAAGSTPATVFVPPGAHSVLLRSSGMIDGQYAVQMDAAPGALDAILWRNQPRLTRLRPALPGAVLADVRFLAGGDLALSIALPIGKEMQAWRLEPASGTLEPLLLGAVGGRLAVAADGQRVAYTGFDVGPPGYSSKTSRSDAQRLAVLWLAHRGEPAPNGGWRAPLAADEQLLDVSWSPTGERLLVVAGASRATSAQDTSRLWVVDATTLQAREMLTLPSEFVPGSALWSPDGQHVAFLAHAGSVNALCLLDLAGDFRYVADLEPSSAKPHPYPPAAWSKDSRRLLVVAPRQAPPGSTSSWLQQDVRHSLYVASVDEPTPSPVGDTPVDFAAWREDDQVVGLGRLGSDGALDLRLLAAGGSGQHLLELPLRPRSSYAVAWHRERARLLVATRLADGELDYWLAALGVD